MGALDVASTLRVDSATPLPPTCAKASPSRPPLLNGKGRGASRCFPLDDVERQRVRGVDDANGRSL